MANPAGNFLTLQQGVQLFGADAMRITFADAGDSIDDANFVSSTANSAILRLTKELAWIQEVLEAQPKMRTGQRLFADRVFANEISHAAHMTKEVSQLCPRYCVYCNLGEMHYPLRNNDRINAFLAALIAVKLCQ